MPDQDETWLLNEKYDGEKSPAFFADCERLAAGEPLAYVIGHIPFLGCTIWLDSHPLIPRPETEFWVEKAIAAMKGLSPRTVLGNSLGRSSGVLKVLDLCAGSGCIGVAIAKHVQNAHVTFAEIDPTHLPTIEKNCRTNTPIDWSICASDLFENVTETFDYILSNPPYIDPVLDRTEASVKNFEPHLALYGGQGGSELLERIITAAPVHLNPGGELWLEHEPEQAALIAEHGTQNGFRVSTHPDQFGTLRYSRLVLQ